VRSAAKAQEVALGPAGSSRRAGGLPPNLANLDLRRLCWRLQFHANRQPRRPRKPAVALRLRLLSPPLRLRRSPSDIARHAYARARPVTFSRPQARPLNASREGNPGSRCRARPGRSWSQWRAAGTRSAPRRRGLRPRHGWSPLRRGPAPTWGRRHVLHARNGGSLRVVEVWFLMRTQTDQATATSASLAYPRRTRDRNLIWTKVISNIDRQTVGPRPSMPVRSRPSDPDCEAIGRSGGGPCRLILCPSSAFVACLRLLTESTFAAARLSLLACRGRSMPGAHVLSHEAGPYPRRSHPRSCLHCKPQISSRFVQSISLERSGI
jgi:hypothetical protein